MALLDPTNDEHVHAERRLRTELIAWLTTVRAEGQPQSTPVWFDWDGERFLVYSQTGKPKLANIRANPHVSIHLDGDGVGGDIVTIEGTAELDPSVPAADQVPAYIEKHRERIAGYGWTTSGFAADYPSAILVSPTRVNVW